MSKTSETNLKTLSHAIELATKVIENVASDAVANTVDGKQMASREIQHAVAAKMQSTLTRSVTK